MWYSLQNDKVRLTISIKPNAKQTAILRITDDAVHIALNAKPKDGEANKELINFLAKYFKLPKSQVSLVRGKKSRIKTIEIPLTDRVTQFIER